MYYKPYGLSTQGYLDKLSTTAYLRGVFSLKTLFLKALNKPLVNISNALTGGITQDFSGNSTGTTLVSTSNGIPLSLWLSENGGGSIGYVQIWYDQSQYVNGGTAYNATAVTRPTINTTTTPWSVDGTNGGYFNLPGGTIPLNSTYTLSAKVNGSGTGGIFGGGQNANSEGNNLRFNGSSYGFQNYWYYNDYSYSVTSGTQPIVTSVINYVTGSAPTANIGVVFTGGTSSTSYTTAGYIAGSSASTNPTLVRSSWIGTPDVNDLLMKTKGDTVLGSNMFWGVISLQAVSDIDRNIIEGI